MNRYEIALGKPPPKICVNDLELGPMESCIDLDLDPGSDVIIKIKKWHIRPSYWNSQGGMDYLNGATAEAQTSSSGYAVNDKTGSHNYWLIGRDDVEEVILKKKLKTKRRPEGNIWQS